MDRPFIHHSFCFFEAEPLWRIPLEEVTTITGSIPPSSISPKLVQEIGAELYQGAARCKQQEMEKLGPEPEKPEKPEPEMADTPASRAFRDIVGQFLLKSTARVDWEDRRRRIESDLNRFQVALESKQAVQSRTLRSSSLQGLMTLDKLPAGLTLISIEAGSMPSFLGKVTFDLSCSPPRGGYSIAGHDPVIVNGVAANFEAKLKENRSRNRFAYMDRYIAVVALAWSFLIGWVAVRLLLKGPAITDTAVLAQFLFALFILFVVLFRLSARLLQWLFPYFTYEGEKQSLLRKVAIGVLLTVAGAIVAWIVEEAIRLVGFAW